MALEIIHPRRRVNPRYVEPAVARCHCGKEISLSDPLTNHCECGRAYNMCGQEVQSNYGREQCIRDGWAFDESDY